MKSIVYLSDQNSKLTRFKPRSDKWKSQISQKPNKSAIPFAVSVAALLLGVIVVSWLLKTQELSAGLRLALVFWPVTAWVFSLIGYFRLVQQLDELQKRIHLEALAFSFSGVAVAIIACEYLRKAGFISELKPDYVLMMMMTSLPIGFLIARRRYQ